MNFSNLTHFSHFTSLTLPLLSTLPASPKFKLLVLSAAYQLAPFSFQAVLFAPEILQLRLLTMCYSPCGNGLPPTFRRRSALAV